MALPLSRNTNYAAGSQIKSADLNDIQDCIIGDKHGPRLLNIDAAIALGAAANWGYSLINLGLVYDPQWYHSAAAAGDELIIPVPLGVGDRITGVTCYLFAGASGILKAQLWKGAAGTSTAKSTQVASSGTGFLQIALTGITPAAIASGERWWISLLTTASANPKSFYHAEVTYDRP